MRSKDKIKILVIGASGLIGNSLYNYLKKKGYDATGTYFRNKKKKLIFFDIKKTDIKSLKISKNIKYLIISHGININLDKTKKNYKKSYFVNVYKTKKIIDYCFSKKIIPVYISSDGVFDGLKGNYREMDKKNPIHSYGKIKNEVEKHITRSKKRYLIVRTSRVFGVKKNDKTFLTELKRKMNNSSKLKSSYDQIFSPIFLNDLSNYLEKLIKNQNFGIFHLSSIKMISHFEIANQIKDFFKIKKIKIFPCKINSLRLLEKRPLLTHLSTSKFDSIFNVKYNDLIYYLSKLK